MKAVRAKEILLITQNHVGELEEIARVIKNRGVNIRAISAWAFDDEAFFRIVASDHQKAKEILESVGKVEEKNIVVVEMPDEVGQLFQMASKLKDHKIDINYLYATTAQVGGPAMVVFSSDNDERALKVITG